MIQGVNAAVCHEEHRHGTAHHISEILAALLPKYIGFPVESEQRSAEGCAAKDIADGTSGFNRFQESIGIKTFEGFDLTACVMKPGP